MAKQTRYLAIKAKHGLEPSTGFWIDVELFHTSYDFLQWAVKNNNIQEDEILHDALQIVNGYVKGKKPPCLSYWLVCSCSKMTDQALKDKYRDLMISM